MEYWSIDHQYPSLHYSNVPPVQLMGNNLIKQIRKGDIRALASVMSLIEDGDPKVRTVLKAIYPLTGRAHVIGVTGAAGAGKSSLVDRMTAQYRRRRKTVGILAVDPTSLFSTGALLGDRVRMRDHFGDPGVFIRSFATREGNGGLSPAVREAIHLLDAAGKEVIFVETIGVGQDQLEIAALAHTVVVVMTPQTGDEVQVMKAGLAEIADVLVVNKADLSGAEDTVRQLKAFFGAEDFPIVSTSATQSEGIPLLMTCIEKHRSESLDNGRYQSKQIHVCREELLSLLRQKVFARLASKVSGAFETEVERIAQRRTDPYSAADRLARRMDLTARPKIKKSPSSISFVLGGEERGLRASSENETHVRTLRSPRKL